jgi:phage terminase large subunit
LNRWRGAYIAPFRNQAKQVTWDYFREYCKPVPGVKFNESELRIDFPNLSRIYLLGADNPDAIRGNYFDGAVLDEVAQMKHELWYNVVRPLLADRLGWCMFIGTPQGHNLFYDLYKKAMTNSKWHSSVYKASHTGLIDEGELEEVKNASRDAYEQEFECSFEAAIKGAYYAHLLAESLEEGRIGDFPHIGDIPVNTAWDIGISDSTAIWFYQVMPGGTIRFIEYYEDNGENIEYYINLLKDRKYYIYDTHIAPHDISVREFSTGKTRLEFASKLGLDFQIADRIPIQDGINAARNLIPRCYFNNPKCERGLEGLRHYRRDYNTKMDVYKNKPLHDWTSHPADAFRTFAVGHYDEYEEPNIRLNLPTHAKTKYTILKSRSIKK